MMREGVQECEAIIIIEQALVDKTVTGPLAERCEAILAERRRAMLTGLDSHTASGFKAMAGFGWWSSPSPLGSQWYVAGPWQDRSKRLFDAAGEVARAVRK